MVQLVANQTDLVLGFIEKINLSVDAKKIYRKFVKVYKLKRKNNAFWSLMTLLCTNSCLSLNNCLEPKINMTAATR